MNRPTNRFTGWARLAGELHVKKKNNMSKISGVKTRDIAETLEKQLNADENRYKGIKTFYDHGDSSKPEVCQPTTYMGRRYGSDATLSCVDIVVVKDNNVFLAVEIEESQIRPKTIMGDIFGVVLSDKISIKGKPYSVKNATVIIAISDDGKGKQSNKYTRLERHINKYLKSHQSKNVTKIRIITCKEDKLVRRIERLLRLETGRKI